MEEPVDYIKFPITDSEFTYTYVGVIYRDGRGRVFEGNVDDDVDGLDETDDADFTHDRSDFNELLAMAPDERYELLQTWFREQINDELCDPFAFNLDFNGEDVEFHTGSEEALAGLIALFVLTEPGIDPDSGDCITIDSGDTEGNGNRLADDSYRSDRLEQLVEWALEENGFSGTGGYEYNDGAHDQISGYSCSDLCVSYAISDIFRGASARERMKAPAQLRAWLESKGRDADEFLPETEKVA